MLSFVTPEFASFLFGLSATHLLMRVPDVYIRATDIHQRHSLGPHSTVFSSGKRSQLRCTYDTFFWALLRWCHWLHQVIDTLCLSSLTLIDFNHERRSVVLIVNNTEHIILLHAYSRLMLSSCVADFIIIVAVYCIVFVCTFTASNAPPKCTSTGANCVRSCANQPNGDYQSCNECDVYVTCSNGITYDNRECAPGERYGTITSRRATGLHRLVIVSVSCTNIQYTTSIYTNILNHNSLATVSWRWAKATACCFHVCHFYVTLSYLVVSQKMPISLDSTPPFGKSILWYVSPVRSPVGDTCCL